MMLTVEVLLPALTENVISRDLCHDCAETVEEHCSWAASGREGGAGFVQHLNSEFLTAAYSISCISICQTL